VACQIIFKSFSKILFPPSHLPKKGKGKGKRETYYATRATPAPDSPQSCPSMLLWLCAFTLQLQPRLTQPHIGTLRQQIQFPSGHSATTTHTIVGTCHTPCDSSSQVVSAIKAVKPHLIVLEIDKERLSYLLNAPASNWYGNEFLSAYRTAQELDIPVICGDVKLETLPTRFFDLSKWNFHFSSPTSTPNNRVHFVDPIRTLLYDELKSLPLILSILFPFVLLQFPLISSHPPSPITLSIVSLLLLRTFDVLILSRDYVLAESIKSAANIARELHLGNLFR